MKLAVIAAALLLPASGPAPAPAPISPTADKSARPAQNRPAPPRRDIPNLLSTGGANCPSIARQIAEAEGRDRSGDIRTLNREPRPHLLLAVDRHVDGCREVTFLRRNVAPGSAMPNLAPGER